MEVKTETSRSLDVKLGPGRRVVRVTRTEGENGEGGSLVLADGFGVGGTFNRPPFFGRPLVLPADALGPLRKALETLERQPEADASKVAGEVTDEV